MSSYVADQRAGGRANNLSIEEFSRELKYGVAVDAIAAIDDPLDAVVSRIEEHPQHLQSLLLARILSAHAFGTGFFRKAEVYGLDRATRALAVALGNARASGNHPNQAWESAVDAAGAAQLGRERVKADIAATAGSSDPKP